MVRIIGYDNGNLTSLCRLSATQSFHGHERSKVAKRKEVFFPKWSTEYNSPGHYTPKAKQTARTDSSTYRRSARSSRKNKFDATSGYFADENPWTKSSQALGPRRGPTGISHAFSLFSSSLLTSCNTVAWNASSTFDGR